MGKLVITNEDFQKAAVTFDRELLKIPVLALADTTKYMTMRTGVTGTQLVGHEFVNAQFAPYKANRKTDANLEVVLRPLTTYFGSLNAEFDPNEAISTLLGHRASQAMADGLQSAVSAREVLGLIGKQAAEAFVYEIFSAKRNSKGNTTHDLFDGFDTITETDITTEEVSVEKGNLVELDEEITEDNADTILCGLLQKMSAKLRAQDAMLVCSQDIADKYNKAYQKHHSGIVYNSKYEQDCVEGSMGRLKIVALPGKAGSGLIHITTKKNMLVGVDQESDQESVRVKDYAPDTLTYMMRIFFGVQFKTVDSSEFLAVKLADQVQPKSENDKTE